MKKTDRFSCRYRYLVIFLLIVFLAGCRLHSRPEVNLPDTIPLKWQGKISPSDLPVTASLLDLFGHEPLRSLVMNALKNNPDLGATALRLKASRLRLAQTGADRLPSASLTGSRGRNNQASDLITGKPLERNHYGLGLNIAWEIDIWGRLSNLHSQQGARHRIKEIETTGAYDSLAARVIQAWIHVVSTQQSLALQKKRVSALEQIENTILGRYTQGLGTLDELAVARTRTTVGKADISALREKHARQIRLLELLTGRYPGSGIRGIGTLPDVSLPPVQPPLTHLKKRPDIQAALASVEADELAALAAHKARLPGIGITYDRSRSAVSSGAFGSSDILWNLVANMTLPLFQGGRLISEARAAELEAEASIKALTAAILKAVKEVEDYMGLENDFQTREAFLKTAFNQARKSTSYYRTRYKTGLETIQALLNAVEQEMNIHSRIIDLRSGRLANRVDLALALGAGVKPVKDKNQ